MLDLLRGELEDQYPTVGNATAIIMADTSGVRGLHQYIGNVVRLE